LEKEKRKGFSLLFSVLAQLSSSLAARLALLSRAWPVSFLFPASAWAEPSEPPLA
jgi:hypothetical protein